MRFCTLLPATALGLLCLLPGAARAQVKLDFENLANPTGTGGMNSQGLSVMRNGFTVTSPPLTGFYSFATDTPPSFNYTGSVALFNDMEGGITTLTQDNGKPFTLNSIDIANLYKQLYGPGGMVMVVFTGQVQGGGIVTQSFTHGANDALETVHFSNAFTNLTSVRFSQEAPFNQFDNIVVTTAAPVPEFSTLATFGGLLGVGGFSLLRRRRAAR